MTVTVGGQEWACALDNLQNFAYYKPKRPLWLHWPAAPGKPVRADFQLYFRPEPSVRVIWSV